MPPRLLHGLRRPQGEVESGVEGLPEFRPVSSVAVSSLRLRSTSKLPEEVDIGVLESAGRSLGRPRRRGATSCQSSEERSLST